MKDQRLIFTQGWIERLEGTLARQQFYDLKVKGLVLELMPTGAKIFRFRKKFKNKDQRATIGAHPEVSLEQARDQAVLLSAELVKGQNFAVQRKAVKDELTLGDLAQLYFDQYAKDRCVTANEMQNNFKRWFAKEAPLPLSELDSAYIQLCINKLGIDGRYYRANRALDLISAIFGWGVRKKYLQTNPAQSVDQFKERSRERFISPSEFNPLLDAINTYPDERVADFFRLCLYTGARSGNVKSMRWDQVDLELGTWRIPEGKNGDSQTIQLTEAALGVLKRRSETKELNPWVLPGGRSHQPTNDHLIEPKKAWKKILSNAGIENLRVHDLRRTLASWMVMSGSSTPIVMKQLGHKSLAAASVYQRVNNSPVKAAADLAIKAMQEAAAASTVHQLQATGDKRKAKGQ